MDGVQNSRRQGSDWSLRQRDAVRVSNRRSRESAHKLEAAAIKNEESISSRVLIGNYPVPATLVAGVERNALRVVAKHFVPEDPSGEGSIDAVNLHVTTFFVRNQ